MSFPDAVRTCLTEKYAGFEGRASRSEYWWFVLFYVIAFVVATILDQIWGFPLLAVLLWLALIVPSIAATARRLHDTNRSGWWILISLVPFVGSIILLVFVLMPSDPQANQFGAAPAQTTASTPSPPAAPSPPPAPEPEA